MPKNVDHDKRRDLIIEKTYELVLNGDARDVTMRDIASKLEMSPGSLYYYFEDKNALIEKVIIRMIQDDMSMLSEQVALAEDTGSRMKVIIDYIQDRRHFLKQILVTVAEYMRLYKDIERTEFVRKGYAAFELGVQSILGTDDPKLTNVILGGCIGFVAQDIFAPDGSRDDFYREFYTRDIIPLLNQS